MFKKKKKRNRARRSSLLTRVTKKKLVKNKLIRRIVLLGLGLFLIYAYTSGDFGFIRIYSSLQEKKNLQTETKKLEAKIVDLKIQRERLQTDLFYIEKIARERYGMIRKDEKVYKFSEGELESDSLK